MNGLELAFARSQSARGVLLVAAIIGLAASVLVPLLFWTSGVASALGVRSGGMAIAIVAPYLLCMGVGQLIYRVLVRRRRRDATFGA